MLFVLNRRRPATDLQCGEKGPAAACSPGQEDYQTNAILGCDRGKRREPKGAGGGGSGASRQLKFGERQGDIAPGKLVLTSRNGICVNRRLRWLGYERAT